MFVLQLALQVAHADSPLALRDTRTGSLEAHFVGATLALDDDGDGDLDDLDQPGGFAVSGVPSGAGVELAVLYWSASIAQVGAACTGVADTQVQLTPPGGATTTITASACECSDAASPTFDLWVCSAEIPGIVESSTVNGTWQIDGVDAFVNDFEGQGATSALALWVSDPSFPTRTVSLYEGLQSLASSSTTTTLSGFEAAGGAGAQLVTYAVDGDVGVSPGEQINIEALPSGNTLGLVDAANPFDDLFNGSVTTGTVPVSGALGIDLDVFEVGAVFDVADTSLAVEASAGSDQVWLLAHQLTVETFDPDLGSSSLDWALQVDANADGEVSTGDTVRFTALLTNSGPEGATFDLIDGMPAWAATWSLVDAGTGLDVSTADTLSVQDIVLGPGQSTSVQFDLVVGTPPDTTIHTDVATYTAPIEGGTGGQLVAPPMLVRTDSDGDGVFDEEDVCPGGSDVLDTDGDTVADGCDVCSGFDDRLDADGDGVPDACDQCVGFDDALDADGDGAPDGCDVCPGADDFGDDDGDGVPDGCDVCPDNDDRLDADGDTVPDGCDTCPGSDDRLDIDGDGVADACDRCSGFDDTQDSDGDYTPDGCDVCPGGDDSGEADGDGVPDACDVCDGFDDRIDSDFDGIPDGCDTCFGDAGAPDSDGDTVADLCDVCDGADDRIDTDGDGIPNGCDSCDGDPTDSDGDSVPDVCDICPVFDDRLDGDGDGYPDGCDRCLAGDDADDADGDYTPDACDLCPGADDSGDADGDGIPDGCDACDGFDDNDDADGDGVPDACDLCPDFDDASDSDGDTIPDACDNCVGLPNVGQTDADNDGLGDRCDPCPTVPGEDDLDGDGTPACIDCNDADPLLNLLDVDSDGVSSCDGDCADTDPAVSPDQPELPNGRDDDCDGLVDNATVRADDDGDGFTELGGDCDDTDADVHPGAVETCDGRDEDCDGERDEGTSCFDDDGDGFCEAGCSFSGDCDDTDATVAPDQPEQPGNGVDDDCNGRVDDTTYDGDGDGYSILGGDCDDGDASVHPGALETADNDDEDCDGLVDEGTTQYDDDGDGFSEGGGDCHDGDPSISPAGTEVEDGIDNDCDGIVDNGTDGVDDDGDGYAELAGDCDDADPTVYPGAQELDDQLDNDCDGIADEDFQDLDRDGYTFASGDCNDENGWMNPGLGEFCDNLDNNCNGEVDEGDVCFLSANAPAPTGGGTSGSSGCASAPAPLWLVLPVLALARRRARWLPFLAALAGCQPEVSVSPTLSRLLVGPALLDFDRAGLGERVRGNIQLDHIDGPAIEVRGVLVTNLAGEHFTYVGPESLIVNVGETVNLPIDFVPLDEGWHTATVQVLHEGLSSPDDVAIRGRAVPPATRLSALGLDFGRVGLGERRSLDIRIDNESDIPLVLTEVSSNNDRFSVDFSAPREVRPDGSQVFSVEFVPAAPDATRGELSFVAGESVVGRVALWGNACGEGLVDAYDADGDGFSVCNADCDDTDAGRHPGAAELDDGIDQDCDGDIDEGMTSIDDDGDGACDHGSICSDGSEPGDCNDADPTVGPMAAEVVGNGIDDDCDGTVDVSVRDRDGDGFAESGGDCDDTNPARHPGHIEVADGVDNDCDGTVDEGTERHDDDGDGWCEGPVCSDGTLPGDCDDTDAVTWPGTSEIPDWNDNDCDGQIDETTVNGDDDGDGYTENGGDCDDADPLRTPVSGCP